MARCKNCMREMTTAVGCLFNEVQIGAHWHARLLHIEAERCGDCGATKGQPHHPGCDMEFCPVCGEQMMCCECDVKKLRRREHK